MFQARDCCVSIKAVLLCFKQGVAVFQSRLICCVSIKAVLRVTLCSCALLLPCFACVHAPLFCWRDKCVVCIGLVTKVRTIYIGVYIR